MKLFMLAIGVFMASPAFAVTYYVRVGGNNTHTCTQAQTDTDGTAMAAPRIAILCMASGDTVVIHKGIYNDFLSCPAICIPNGSVGNMSTVKSAPGETAIFHPTGLGNDHIFDFYNQSYIVLDGLGFDGGDTTSDPIQFGATEHHITIQNCDISHMEQQGNGINVGPDAHDILISNVSIHDSVPWDGTGIVGPHGIYVAGFNNIVEKSRIYNVGGYGIHGYSAYFPRTSHDNTYISNTIHDVEPTHTDSSVGGILLSSGDNNVAYNNVIYGCPIGIRIWDNSTNGKAYNNSVYNNVIGISITSGSTDTTATNNIVYSNGTNIGNAGGGTVTLTTNLTTDPLWVNAPGGDFHLTATSAAVNTGTSLSGIFTADRDGVRRTIWDIGAYEFTTGFKNLFKSAAVQ